MYNPAEMPGPDDPGSGGGFGRIRIPREIPQELPAFVARSLVSEIVLLRNRLNAIENAAIVARFGGFSGVVGGPNELPNPDDPGGGGGIVHGEIPFEIPREIPWELPPDVSVIETLVDSRINALRTEILGQLAEMKELIQAKRG